MAQPPFKQAGAPLFELQVVAQVPQWSGSKFKFDSQPLAAFPSQFPRPALQVIPHAPLEQLGVPFEELQTLPHIPQLVTSFPSGVSQPLLKLPSQLPDNAPHVMLQAPPEHVAVPLVLLHTLLH
jgi:hypothetical protein